MWVGTITRKPKEFRYIFLLETRFFTTNGSASFSDIERIWNHQRHLYFDRHISSISSRATSRFKFERDWRYLFIQIKMTKERRCSLHWLRGCSTRMYRSFPKNNSKKIRYLTLYLNTNSQSTSWYTQPPTSSAVLAWIQAPDMFGYKNIYNFRFRLSIKLSPPFWQKRRCSW